MKKTIVGLALALASLTAFSATMVIDTDKMSIEQIKQIEEIKQNSAPKEQPESISKEVAAVRTEVGAWGEMGKGIGVALIAAAREVGVAANEFAATPLGKVTTAIIVYKMVGKSIIGLMFGTFVLLVGFYWGIRLLRSAMKHEYKTEQVPVLFGLWTITKKTIVADVRVTEDDFGLAAMGLVIILFDVLVFSVAAF